MKKATPAQQKQHNHLCLITRHCHFRKSAKETNLIKFIVIPSYPIHTEWISLLFATESLCAIQLSAEHVCNYLFVPCACLRFCLGLLFCFMISFRAHTHTFGRNAISICYVTPPRGGRSHHVLLLYSLHSVLSTWLFFHFMFAHFSLDNTDLMNDDPKNMCCVY